MTDRTGLKGRPRRNVIATVRSLGQPCWLCGYPIDLNLDTQRDPLGSSIDEVIPRSHDGDPLDLANLRHAHRICNSRRGTQPVTAELQESLRDAQRHAYDPPTASRTW